MADSHGVNDYGDLASRPDMAAVIVGYARSPFTPAHKGALSSTRPEDFCAPVVRELLSRCSLMGDDVEDLLLGCAYPEGSRRIPVHATGGSHAVIPGIPAADSGGIRQL